MKFSPRRWALFAVAALGAALLASCSTVSTRIEKNRAAFDRLPPAERELASRGQIREGMSKEAVFIAWGQRDQTSVVNINGKPSETWIYLAYQDVYPFGYAGYGYGGFGFGGFGYGGFGGYGGFYRGRGHRFAFYEPFYDPFFYGPVARERYPYKLVSFRNDRVIAFQYLIPPRAY